MIYVYLLFRLYIYIVHIVTFFKLQFCSYLIYAWLYNYVVLFTPFVCMPLPAPCWNSMLRDLQNDTFLLIPSFPNTYNPPPPPKKHM